MSIAGQAVGNGSNQGPEDGGERTPAQGEGEGSRLPFVRAASPVTRKTDYDVTRTLTTSQQQLPTLSVPTVGYLRGVWLRVRATGGNDAGTAVVAHEDAPFSVFREVIFRDVNGAPLLTLSGYQLFVASKYGGHSWFADARSHPEFSDPTAGEGDFTFWIRVPLEIVERDAYGALANQNAASPYQIELVLAADSDVYDTSPDTTLPDVRVTAYIEAWSQPPATDPITGLPTQRKPRFLDTTQRFTRQINEGIGSGESEIQLTHVGNWIRGLTFIMENDSDARSNSDFPDEATLWLDDRQLAVLQADLWHGRMVQDYGYDGSDDAAGGLDTGVFHYTFADDMDGHTGSEMRTRYLLTSAATDLRLTGSFGTNAERLITIYNQVLPPEKAPSGRQAVE